VNAVDWLVANHMSDADSRYDVFISYSRDDSEWVIKHIYGPLLRCLLPDGRRPRIFFDVGKEGIPLGYSFQDVIAKAIENSSKVVLVYSASYFKKPMCEWELTMCLTLYPLGQGKLVGVLKDPDESGLVPLKVSHINYLTVAAPDWFTELCRALELYPYTNMEG
jgi:hypothetical protein